MSNAKRLSVLERRSKGTGLLIIGVVGGLPLGTCAMEATAGGHLWQQEADESEDAFAERVTTLARAANQSMLVIGGLPSAFA